MMYIVRLNEKHESGNDNNVGRMIIVMGDMWDQEGNIIKGVTTAVVLFLIGAKVEVLKKCDD